MRRPNPTLLSALSLIFTLGCPDPPDDLVTTPPGQQAGTPGGGDAPPPSGDAGVPPPPGEGEGGGEPSGEPGPPSEDGDQSGGDLAPPPGGLPTFEDVIDGDTVTISGAVTGADAAQIDFLVIEEVDGVQRPKVLHVTQAEGGAFEVTAPATWDAPIYISAVVDATGDGPTPDDAEGGLAEPIALSGADVTIALDVTVVPDWLTALRSAAPEAAIEQPVDPPLEEGAGEAGDEGEASDE